MALSQKINITCPYCHAYSDRDILFEVVFNNFAITFKCNNCKKIVRIWLEMKEYGQMEKASVEGDEFWKM